MQPGAKRAKTFQQRFVLIFLEKPQVTKKQTPSHYWLLEGLADSLTAYETNNCVKYSKRTSLRGNVFCEFLRPSFVSAGPVPRNCYEAIPLTNRGPNSQFYCVSPDELTEMFIWCVAFLWNSFIKVIVFNLVVPALNHLSTIDTIVNHRSFALWNSWLKIRKVFT